MNAFKIAILLFGLATCDFAAAATAEQLTAPVGASESAKTVSPEDLPPIAVPKTIAGAADLDCRDLFDGKVHTTLCVYQSSRLSTKEALMGLISTLALMVSIGTLWYTRNKDVKTRRQSIEDEFWIRKVLSPIALEPLIKEITDLVSKLPEDCESPAWRKDGFKPFITSVQPKLQQLQSSMHALAMLDPSVCVEAQKHLSAIEDLVLEYCGANAGNHRSAVGRGKLLKRATSQRIIEEMLSSLGAIKSFQVSQV
jgi:hypothetical protein